MNSQFHTYLLDKALIKRKEALEQERQTTLKQVQHWLENRGKHYRINSAYLFGSFTRSRANA
ncbi:MAG: hypothetical protein AAFQ91_31170 [Cyanobacteria bacterium J06621_15]